MPAAKRSASDWTRLLLGGHVAKRARARRHDSRFKPVSLLKLGLRCWDLRVNLVSQTAMSKRPKRQRLSRADREQMIVREAIRYFAEVGFTGQTRELARRIGVTQSLLFRYFPTKEHLIERVYQEVYLRRWNPYWETVLADRSIPLTTRLTNLYLDYSRTFTDYDWIRIFMFSGLLGDKISRSYAALFRDRVIIPMCHEIRHELRLPKVADTKLKPEELQVCWAINAAVAMLAVREFIFDSPTSQNHQRVIPAIVQSFMEGAPAVFRQLNNEPPKRALPRRYAAADTHS